MMRPTNSEVSFVIPEGKETRFLWSESWRMAWPVFVGQAVSTSMILISRMMVGAIGESTLAALGIGQMIFFAMVMGLTSVSVGMVALMARAVGAGDRPAASRIFGQGTLVGTIISVALAGIGILCSRPIFVAMHIAPEILDDAVTTMIILFAGLPFASASFFLGAGLRGAGDTRTPMILITITTVFNMAAQYILMFGKLGLPQMGIIGAGVAMGLAFMVAIALFVLLFAFRLSALPINFSGFKIDWGIIKKIIKIGGPTAVEWELIQLGLVAFVSIVNHYGTEAGAAYIIGLTILNFAQLPAIGYNAAATTMVGMCLGAKRMDLAEKSVRINLLAAVILMSIISLLLIAFARPVIQTLFPNSSELTVEYARLYLLAVAVCQPLMALSFVQAGALRGAGYSISPMIAQSSGMYVFRIGLAVVLWKVYQTPVFWLFLTQLPDFIYRSVFLSISFRGGKWKLHKV